MKQQQTKLKDKILLHICCGPCSTYPIVQLQDKFDISGYFFNPNIYPNEEKDLRKINAKKAADYFNVNLIEDDELYDHYLDKIKGKELNFNRERCRECYKLRLIETAKKARDLKIRNFSTTLLISPYQDIKAIKEIGERIAEQYQLKFFFEDFRSGFSESRKISKELGLYRQNYCGCSFSLNEK